MKTPGELLKEELDRIVVSVPKNLFELFYTAQENGMDMNDTILAYKLVLLAQSYDGRPIDHLKM